MTIGDAPIIIGDIAYFKDFVIRNNAPLLAYWSGTLDTSELTSQLEF